MKLFSLLKGFALTGTFRRAIKILTLKRAQVKATTGSSWQGKPFYGKYKSRYVSWVGDPGVFSDFP
jgi:hypothetical protein